MGVVYSENSYTTPNTTASQTAFILGKSGCFPEKIDHFLRNSIPNQVFYRGICPYEFGSKKVAKIIAKF
jgi:hypothetical protein